MNPGAEWIGGFVRNAGGAQLKLHTLQTAIGFVGSHGQIVGTWTKIGKVP